MELSEILPTLPAVESGAGYTRHRPRCLCECISYCRLREWIQMSALTRGLFIIFLLNRLSYPLRHFVNPQYIDRVGTPILETVCRFRRNIHRIKSLKLFITVPTVNQRFVAQNHIDLSVRMAMRALIIAREQHDETKSNLITEGCVISIKVDKVF